MQRKSRIPSLEDQRLLRNMSYVDGAWEAGEAREPLRVSNPATGATIAEIRTASAADTRRAIEAAHRAFKEWRRTTVKERAGILRRWHELTIEAAEDLAALMTAEQGKTLLESRGEIQYGASFIEWFAEQAKRADGDVFPGATPHTRAVCIRQPVGVVAAITPWNLPNAMIARKVAPALAAGCTVVVKPAEDTPLSALAMAELADRAGFPAGCFNVVVGAPEQIGPELTGSPLVRKVSFTGSTEVGRLLEAQCAPTLKRTTMELGGNAPFIVFDDADLDDAIAGALLSKYRNSGQTCVCANRFLVQDSIHDEFCERLVAATGKLALGNGADEGVTQGPLINTEAVEKVSGLVDASVAAGAECLIGGKPSGLGECFYPHTILRDVTPEMPVFRNEIFGPVAALTRFSDEAEAIALANDTDAGLCAYVYSRDIGRVWRAAEALEYGMVGMNEGIISSEMAPFGGIKASGWGREGSRYGMDDFMDIKYLCLGGLDR
ncbi:MAG: NAD-dependent succinate-semialdehyde dehydrogenase [Gammaproteobacteria bacterium]|nr:NAD-dependent succinate-semialdehyde dehydrogenase [Gammaproteobacteria bacterium]MCY4340893.1 NAD-dependent succinate-semialdehyde dehydrogenase [Gammaproteobacteria bacterium]